MSKKMRPSLKDYLKTGEVHVAWDTEKRPAAEVSVPEPRADAFLDFLTPSDLEMWKGILGAGTEVRLLRLEAEAARKDFSSMDRSRFTYYMLAGKGEPVRPVRSDSQIQDSLMFLFKWDETGVLTVYTP